MMPKSFRNSFMTLFLFALLLTGCSNNTESEGEKWQLIWQDEFDGSSGQLPDSANWNFEIGDGTLYGLPSGWGNNQLEYNTNRPENVSLDGQGNLVITARAESFEAQNYTSARITTKNKFEQTYGRFEARMQLPTGRGMWPAFWMLGADIDDVGWPACGEIDIMEYRGQEPFRIHGSVHGPGYFGGQPVTEQYDLTNDRFDTGFNVFSVEWGNDYLRFYVNGNRYQTITPEDLPGPWVFDDPFYIIMNLAVGGNYLGPPDQTTLFPQTLLVDYVRVYEKK